MDKLTIELTVEQTQYVLNVLAEKPYQEVADIISEVTTQANAQLAPKED